MASNQQSASPTSPLRALCHRYLNPVYPLQNHGHLPAKHWLYPSHTRCTWLSCHLLLVLSCPVLSRASSSQPRLLCSTDSPGHSVQPAAKRSKGLEVPL